MIVLVHKVFLCSMLLLLLLSSFIYYLFLLYYYLFISLYVFNFVCETLLGVIFSPFIYLFIFSCRVFSVLLFMYLFNAYIWVKDEKGFKHKNNKCNTALNCCCFSQKKSKVFCLI